MTCQAGKYTARSKQNKLFLLARSRVNAVCVSTEAQRASRVRKVHLGRRVGGCLGARWPVASRCVGRSGPLTWEKQKDNGVLLAGSRGARTHASRQVDATDGPRRVGRFGGRSVRVGTGVGGGGGGRTMHLQGLLRKHLSRACHVTGMEIKDCVSSF
jgi:hypothetical protein